MLTQYEVEKLRREMHSELNSTWIVLVKCIAGLVIVLALGLFGREIELQRDATTDSTAAMAHASSEMEPASSRGEMQPETPGVDDLPLTTGPGD